MVSWGYAPDKGMEVFILVFAWQVLGFLIAAGISAGGLFAILQNPASIGTVFAQSFFAIFVGLLIGGIVAAIGTYATIIKVSVESAQELQLIEEAETQEENKRTTLTR